ncbi:MAG: hypothetical protein PHC61_08115 [Chitinivibrionales bacterium]|nr:hypothetical protein [Chitinivibrionales bacterium]
MDTKNELNSFFDSLGERFYKENDASDMLVAAVQASQDMANIFTEFFGIEFDQKTHAINREYTIDNSRPDIVIKSKGIQKDDKPVIIEVKLFDQNYHRDEYPKLLDNSKCILLSAHKIKEKAEDWKAWEIKDWSELIKKMEESDKRSKNVFVESLAKYFRKVTLVKEIKKIDFSTPQANLYIARLIEEIIKENKNVRWGNQRSYTEDYFGYQYFSPDNENKGNLYLASFLYCFSETYHGMEICIWDRENQELTQSLRLKGYEVLCKKDEKNMFVVRMIESEFKDFKISEKEKQKELLKTYFSEVNDIVRNYFAQVKSVK